MRKWCEEKESLSGKQLQGVHPWLFRGLVCERGLQLCSRHKCAICCQTKRNSQQEGRKLRSQSRSYDGDTGNTLSNELDLVRAGQVKH